METLRKLGLWRVDGLPLDAGLATASKASVIGIEMDPERIQSMAQTARQRRLLELGAAAMPCGTRSACL